MAPLSVDSNLFGVVLTMFAGPAVNHVPIFEKNSTEPVDATRIVKEVADAGTD